MIKHISIVFFALFFQGCQAPVRFADTADGKYKEVLGSDFNVFIVRNEQAFKDYHSLLLLPLALDSMEIDKETEPGIAKTWKLDEETKRLILDYYSGARSSYSEKRRERTFRLVNEPASGVMAAEFRLGNFRPFVSKDGADMANIVTEARPPSLGRLSLEITIVDALSGEFIAYILDGRHVGNELALALDINKISQARIWRSAFVTWFNKLDESIDRLKAQK